jgi:hypothetical protein
LEVLLRPQEILLIGQIALTIVIGAANTAEVPSRADAGGAACFDVCLCIFAKG